MRSTNLGARCHLGYKQNYFAAIITGSSGCSCASAVRSNACCNASHLWILLWTCPLETQQQVRWASSERCVGLCGFPRVISMWFGWPGV